MARIRTIKPEFFLHEELYDSEASTGLPLRLAFAGLWTQADREGRFVWRPRKLKTQILPYDEIDFESVLDALHRFGFIAKYTVDSEVFGYIPSWSNHQTVNVREPESKIPAPQDDRSSTVPVPYRNIPAQDENVFARVEGKGREGKGKEGKIRGVAAPPAVADSSSGGDISNSPADPKPECHQTNEKAPPRRSKRKYDRSCLPTLPIDLQAIESLWEEWLCHREEIKSPLTPIAAKQQIDRMREMGVDRARAALRWTMSNGWRGMREPDSRDGPFNRYANTVHDSSTPVEDMNRWKGVT